MQQTNVQLPQMTKINAVIIAVSAGFFLLESILVQLAGVSLVPFLGLSLSGMGSGLLYQVVTYPFAPASFLQILFSGLILWFLGCELERQWGGAYYIFILLVSSLIGGLVYLLIASIFFMGSPIAGIALAGTAGISSGLCLLYAILYPERQFIFMFLFPMKAKFFCMILVGINLYQGIFSPGGVLAWGHLGTMAGAFVAYRLLAMPKLRYWIDRFSLQLSQTSQPFGAGRGGRKSTRRNSNLRIVRDEKDDDDKRPPKYWQ